MATPLSVSLSLSLFLFLPGGSKCRNRGRESRDIHEGRDKHRWPHIVILSLFLYLVLTVCMLVPLQCSSHPISFTWRWIERAVEIGIEMQTRIDEHSIDTLYLYAWGLVVLISPSLYLPLSEPLPLHLSLYIFLSFSICVSLSQERMEIDMYIGMYRDSATDEDGDGERWRQRLRWWWR